MAHANRANQQAAKGVIVSTPRQQKRLARGENEGSPDDYAKAPLDQQQEGRIRRLIEDRAEARRYGMTLEEYQSL